MPRTPIAAVALFGLVLWTMPAAAEMLTTDLSRVEGGAYAVDPDHSKVIFGISHLGFATYYGAFPKIAGVLDFRPDAPAASHVEITIDIGAIDTSNSKLDAELKSARFLDAAQFPVARFEGQTISVTGPRTGRIDGTLTLHGQTRPVSLEVTFNGGGINPVTKAYDLGFDARATLKRSDFGVTTFLPALGDEVTLTIGAEFTRTK